jgi:hypothetical protein
MRLLEQYPACRRTRESRRNPTPIALFCRPCNQSIFLLPPIGGASLLVYDRYRKAQNYRALITHANRRALIGMEQNPEVKRMVQRSLFVRLAQKPLDLPIEKQQELQTAIAELLLTALTQNFMQEEANIDDDEQ